MKAIQGLTFSLLLLGAMMGHAAVSAQDLISMPYENRIQVLKKSKDKKLVADLEALAFEPKRSMPERWKALMALVQKNEKQAQPLLEKALSSNEWFMVNAGLVGLKTVNPELAHKHALTLLDHKALVVRSAAIQSLKTPLKVQERELLWEHLDSQHNYRKTQSLWIRAEILSRLGEKPLKKEVPLFVKALHDPDIRLHRPAIRALELLVPSGPVSDRKLSDRRQDWIKWSQRQPAGTL
jgi:HEAT repeat protein